MNAREITTVVSNMCEGICQHYVKNHHFDKASKIYQALLEADWLSEHNKRQVRTNQKRVEAWRLYHLGENRYAVGDLNQATRYLKQSAYLAEDAEDVLCSQKVFLKLGDALVLEGNEREAIDFFLKYLNVATVLGDKRALKTAYRKISSLFLMMCDFSSAITYAKEGLKLFQETGDRMGELMEHHILAQAFAATGNNNVKSIFHYQQILEVATSMMDKQWEGIAYSGLGTAYSGIGELENALEYQKKSLDIALELNDYDMLCNAYSGLGTVNHRRGDNSTAVPFYEQALEIATQCQNSIEMQGICHGNLGSTAFGHSDFKKALYHYTTSLEFFKKCGNKVAEGDAYFRIGNTFLAMGDCKQALEYHQKALTLARKCKVKDSEIVALRGIGNVLHFTQQFDKALEVYKEALDVCVEIGDKVITAQTHGDLGNCYMKLEKYMLSLVYHREHLRLCKEVCSKSGECRAHSNLGIATYKLGRYEESLSHHLESLKIAQQIKDKHVEGRCYGNLGNLYREFGEIDKAIEYYTKTVEFARSTLDLQGEAEGCYAIGVLQENIKNHAQAETDMNKCIKKFREIRLRMRNEDDMKVSIGDLHVRAYKMLTVILINQQRFEDAFLACDRGRALALKDLLRRRMGVNVEETDEEDVETTKSCLQSLKQDTESTTLSFTAVLNGDLLSWVTCKDGVTMYIGTSPGGEEFLDKLSKMANTALLTVEGERGNEVYSERDLAARDEEKLEDFFAMASEKNFKPKLTEAMGNLSNECAGKTQLGAVLTKQSQEFETGQTNCSPEAASAGKTQLGAVLTKQSQEFETGQTNCLPEAASKPKDSGPHQAGHNEVHNYNTNPLRVLYNMLIKPVEENLQGNHLRIIPEGFLYKIPYSALLDSQGKYLSDRFSIQVCTSLETLSSHYNVSAHDDLGGALVIGNPLLGTLTVRGETLTPAPLPGAQREAEAVANMFDTSALVLEQATKANVLKYISQASVVHIAAHGDSRRGEVYLAPAHVTCPGAATFHNSEAPASSVMLGPHTETYPGSSPPSEDFLLTCSDIAQLRMRARLVVLSCCQSANGTIRSAEGVVGIARSFMGAGAASVLVTLWAISDAATEVFMHYFYWFLLQGSSCCVAVQKSMKKLRETEQFQGASNWAPFYIIGHDVTFSDADVERIKSRKFF